MLYLYVGGVLVALVNGFFVTRKLPVASLVTPVVILAIAVVMFPTYAGAVSEINTEQYAEIHAITAEIKDDEGAQSIHNLITESMENEKISLNEYEDIQTAYANYKQKSLNKSINSIGVK